MEGIISKVTASSGRMGSPESSPEVQRTKRPKIDDELIIIKLEVDVEPRQLPSKSNDKRLHAVCQGRSKLKDNDEGSPTYL